MGPIIQNKNDALSHKMHPSSIFICGITALSISRTWHNVFFTIHNSATKFTLIPLCQNEWFKKSKYSCLRLVTKWPMSSELEMTTEVDF